MTDVAEYIQHYGRKGMKWGTRKDKRSTTTSKKTSADHKKVSEIRKRERSELTNNQLKIVNERINLEQNFNRLNPSKIKRGTIMATSILSTLGVGVTAYNMINSPAGKAAITVGKKAVVK